MIEILGIFTGDDFADCARLRWDGDFIFISGERIYLTSSLTSEQGFDLSGVKRAVLDFIENAGGGAERLVGKRAVESDVASAVSAVVREACDARGARFISLVDADIRNAGSVSFVNGGRWISSGGFRARVLADEFDRDVLNRFWRAVVYGVLAALSNPQLNDRGGPKR